MDTCLLRQSILKQVRQHPRDIIKYIETCVKYLPLIYQDIQNGIIQNVAMVSQCFDQNKYLNLSLVLTV